MSHDKWGREGPPPEAYSRVTDPERFQPLHSFAEMLIARLTAQYDVEREEGYDLEPELDPSELTRPGVRLTPRSQRAPLLQISFATFPGLVVRAGHWYRDRFPACGCDACDETAESAIEDFSFVVENVINGHFGERVSLPALFGSAWQSTQIGGPELKRWSRRRTRIPRGEARSMLRESRARYDWEPWPRR